MKERKGKNQKWRSTRKDYRMYHFTGKETAKYLLEGAAMRTDSMLAHTRERTRLKIRARKIVMLPFFTFPAKGYLSFPKRKYQQISPFFLIFRSYCFVL